MIIVGKVREIYHYNIFPSISDLVSEREMEKKADILTYLKKVNVMAAAPGYAIDVFTGNRIQEPLYAYSDGEYIWRSDTIYYFDKYNLRLEDDFIEHVLKQS